MNQITEKETSIGIVRSTNPEELNEMMEAALGRERGAALAWMATWCVKQRCSINNAVRHAAHIGDLEAIEQAAKADLEFSVDACSSAASTGQLKALKLLHELGCPWDSFTIGNALVSHHYNIIGWAMSNGCPIRDDYVGVGGRPETVRILGEFRWQVQEEGN